jgi:hypothetical protein
MTIDAPDGSCSVAGRDRELLHDVGGVERIHRQSEQLFVVECADAEPRKLGSQHRSGRPACPRPETGSSWCSLSLRRMILPPVANISAVASGMYAIELSQPCVRYIPHTTTPNGRSPRRELGLVA